MIFAKNIRSTIHKNWIGNGNHYPLILEFLKGRFSSVIAVAENWVILEILFVDFFIPSLAVIIFKATSKEVAEDRLLDLEVKWGDKYSVVIESWQRNWVWLSQYFQYTDPIRKIINTTNTVEGLHLQPWCPDNISDNAEGGGI